MPAAVVLRTANCTNTTLNTCISPICNHYEANSLQSILHPTCNTNFSESFIFYTAATQSIWDELLDYARTSSYSLANVDARGKAARITRRRSTVPSGPVEALQAHGARACYCAARDTTKSTKLGNTDKSTVPWCPACLTTEYSAIWSPHDVATRCRALHC
jgi:hypothetical protein